MLVEMKVPTVLFIELFFMKSMPCVKDLVTMLMRYETVLLLSITYGNRWNLSFGQYGSTNDIDSVDGAPFRSGRIDTPIEVGLSDDQERLQIFDIYTKALLRKGILQADINTNSMISNSERFSGADIEHVVRLALHNAMPFDIVDKERIDIRYEEADQLQVCKRDLMLALVKVRETDFSRKNCTHN